MRRQPEEVERIIRTAISPYSNYCDGYGNSGSSGNGYILGVTLGIGKSTAKLSHKGSTMLSEIDAFDLAEVDDTYIGQLNMSIVSSFCGPQGLIWGYDVLQPAEGFSSIRDTLLTKNLICDIDTRISSIDGLINATRALFGTNENRRFMLRPGAHVPFASKNIKVHGPAIVYAGVAIGIPKDRDKDACLLMEDIGEVPFDISTDSAQLHNYESKIKTNLVNSVCKVGENQKITYSEILVGIKSILVKSGEVGCALVACPYFTIAHDAIPIDPNGILDYSGIIHLNSIQEWENKVIHGNITYKHNISLSSK